LPVAEIRPALHGSFAVFFCGDEVVKLVPRKWRDKLIAERDALSRVKLDVPVPSLLAEGELDSWGYLVMTRLPGQRIGDGWAARAPGEQARLVRRIGEILAQLHTIPVEPSREWPDFVARQRASAAERHARSGADPRWVRDIEPFLASVPPWESRHVLVHADVTDDHVLVEGDRVTGLFDFGDALVGDPLYDFASPVCFIVNGRADLLRAFVDGYGCATDLRERFLAMLLTHRYAQLKREVDRLQAAPATLEEVARAFWPIS
jgi:hygromycin-B 7''-O-kinase